MGWRDALTEEERLEGTGSWEEIQAARQRDQVVISTGDLRTPYEHVDCVFAMGSHSATAGGVLAAQPTTAFVRVKDLLREEARKRGADAIIHAQFQYRVAVGTSILGSVVNSAVPGVMSSVNQVFEVFAYGTAVKRLGGSGDDSPAPDATPRPSAPPPASATAKAAPSGPRLNPGKVLVDAGLPQYIKLFTDRGVGDAELRAMDTLGLMKLGVRDPDHCVAIVQAIRRALTR